MGLDTLKKGSTMKNKAFIFPGQGAQKPFMGKTFFDGFLEAREVYQEAEDLLSMNISSKIFSSDELALKDTAFCQVALFVTSMAILKTLESQAKEIVPFISAGLSLGEYSALVASKKVKYQDLLPIIKQRGILMQKASNASPQGMCAVIGLQESEIPKKYQIANLNSPGQIVIAGSITEMNDAKEVLKIKGARKVIPLKVSGAFHTSYMETAKKHLSPFIKGCTMTPSFIHLVMNVTGKITDDMDLIKANLIEQMTKTTRWADCITEMEKLDVDYIELGPAQLSAMNKRNNTNGTSLNIEEVKDIEGLYEKI